MVGQGRHSLHTFHVSFTEELSLRLVHATQDALSTSVHHNRSVGSGKPF